MVIVHQVSKYKGQWHRLAMFSMVIICGCKPPQPPTAFDLLFRQIESGKPIQGTSIDQVIPQLTERRNASDPKIDSHFKNLSLLEIAILKDNKVAIRELLSYGFPVNDASPTGRTALITAAAFGRPHAIDDLLQNGADPSLRDHQGRTPLFAACFWGSLSCVKRLVAVSADVDADDSMGRTPLLVLLGRELGLAEETIESLVVPGKRQFKKLSLSRDGEMVVTQLLDAGASPTRRTKGGIAPLHLAILSQLDGLVNMMVAKSNPVELRSKQEPTFEWWAKNTGTAYARKVISAMLTE